MEQIKLTWKPITEPPQNSGYVLLAITHHDIPMVLMGFCKITGDGSPRYSEEIYNGRGVSITHWTEFPQHPMVSITTNKERTS